MMYELPTSLSVGGADQPIRSDYRAALDICAALSDPDYSDEDKAEALLKILYEQPETLTDIDEAVRQALWFLSLGDDSPPPDTPRPKLMDWKQDAPLIIGAVNRVAGAEVRALPYLHWWTFIGYYMEIGDCAFASVVSIRNKQAKHKKLDSYEKEFYRENRRMIDFRSNGVSDADKEFVNSILKG